MAEPDETRQSDPAVESLPAMRAAGSRSHGVSRGATFAIAGAAISAAALVVILVVKPWSSSSRTPDPQPPVGEDPVQARFDAERRPDKIIHELGIKPGFFVADIGASTGLLTVHLARAVSPDGRVTATDIDAGVLGLLVTRIEKAKLSDNVETKVVPSDSPGLDTGTYDVILLSQVDHLFTDATAWLEAAKPALKPNGKFGITNLLHHRQKGMAAAQKAGLLLVSETIPTPSHYLAVFTVAR
jgi:2-polyprenyl-3-methyl-5-hydroxy-6-metoxy-1,4-benzoquinol methylase